MIIPFHVEVKIDHKLIMERIEKEVSSLQGELDALVLQDSNFFCPLETGGLQKSAIIDTTLGKGLLIWNTPYARRQYYGEHFDHSKQRNKNACSKWFEAAKARYLPKWEKFVYEWLRHRRNN